MWITISVCLFFLIAKSKPARLEDVLNILASGFLKGTLGGFLKTSSAGEMIKGSNTVNREIRVGITHVSMVYGHSFFLSCFLSNWEKKISNNILLLKCFILHFRLI